MTAEEKLAKVRKIIEHHKKRLREDLNHLEATAFHQHNMEVYDKMMGEIEKILKL